MGHPSRSRVVALCVALASGACAPAPPTPSNSNPSASATSTELAAILARAEGAGGSTTVDRAPGPDAGAPVGGAPSDGHPSVRVQTLRRLKARDFAALTAQFEALQGAVERDITSEGAMWAALSAFSTADASVTPLLDAWVGAAPASFAPKLARAEHRLRLAFTTRGTALARNTPEAQMQGMVQHLADAVGDIGDVLTARPTVVEAYRQAIETAYPVGNHQGCVDAAQRALAIAPASLRVRWTLNVCLMPRWGGRYEAIAAVAREASAHLASNPALAVLEGVADWDIGRDTSGEAGLERMTVALRFGAHPSFYRDRARRLLGLERPADALLDAARGLELEPDHPEILLLRARALLALDRPAEAARDLRVARELQGPSEELSRVARACTHPSCGP